MHPPPCSSLPKLKRVAKRIADAVDTVTVNYRDGLIGDPHIRKLDELQALPALAVLRSKTCFV
jgi:hypothetical protein